jgi:hypothetical protein
MASQAACCAGRAVERTIFVSFVQGMSFVSFVAST